MNGDTTPIGRVPDLNIDLYGHVKPHNALECREAPCRRIHHILDIHSGQTAWRSLTHKYVGYVQRRIQQQHAELCKSSQPDGTVCNIPKQGYHPASVPRKIADALDGRRWRQGENVFILPQRYYADANAVQLDSYICCRSEEPDETVLLEGVVTMYSFRVVDRNTGKVQEDMPDTLYAGQFAQTVPCDCNRLQNEGGSN